MIALYSTEDAVIAQIVPLTIERSQAAIAGSWSELERIAPAAQVLVLSVSLLDGGADRVRRLRTIQPQAPILLITSAHPDNAYWLKDLEVAELVWTEEAGCTLTVKLHALLDADPLEPIARALTRQDGLPGKFREGLARALRRPVPPMTAKALARECGYTRQVLYKRWRDHFQSGVLTAKEFTECVALVRATFQMRMAPPRDIPAWISRPHLSRWAKKYLQHTPREIARAGEWQLLVHRIAEGLKLR